MLFKLMYVVSKSGPRQNDDQVRVTYIYETGTINAESMYSHLPYMLQDIHHMRSH